MILTHFSPMLPFDPPGNTSEKWVNYFLGGIAAKKLLISAYHTWLQLNTRLD